MKKLKLDFLFVAALMLGGGMAVAGNLSAVDTNVYNADTSGGVDWQPVPSGKAVQCDPNEAHSCSGLETAGGVTNIIKGDARLVDAR